MVQFILIIELMWCMCVVIVYYVSMLQKLIGETTFNMPFILPACFSIIYFYYNNFIVKSDTIYSNNRVNVTHVSSLFIHA